VRQVFERRDWVSTAELFVIGHAVARMKDKSADGLRSLGKRAVEPVGGNSIGAVFELTIGALFDGPEHPVTIMPANTKGFDLSIALPNGKRLRASCKARIPSEHEIRFRAFVRALDQKLATRLPAGSATLIILRCDQRPSDESAYVASHVEAMLAKHEVWQRQETMEFELPCGRAIFKPLLAEPGQAFWEGAATYRLAAALAFGDNEQVRFRDQLRESVAKFRTHCSDVSDVVGNVVFMKIPTSIRIDEARKLSEEVLAEGAGDVAGVYVYRTQVAATDHGREFYLCHELHEFDNARAGRPTRSYLPDGFTFVITPKVGRVQNIEPVLTMQHETGEMQITQTHLEMRGRVTFFTDARKGGTFHFDRLPNHSVSYVLRKADHFLNVKDAPMKASKLRRLIRAGDLRGYKHGHDVFVAASDFRAFILGRPVEPPRPIAVREPPTGPNIDLEDDLSVMLGIAPKDPAERRAFEARLAARRAGGGERAASLRRTEEERLRMDARHKREKERAEKRAEKKRLPQP
jgi:hypothetical protein